MISLTVNFELITEFTDKRLLFTPEIFKFLQPTSPHNILTAPNLLNPKKIIILCLYYIIKLTYLYY